MTLFEKYIFRGIAVLVLLYLIFCMVACNAYKGIEKHEPQSVKDTARLVARYAKTIPSKPQEIKKGETVYVKDTAELKQLKKELDSVKALPTKVLRLQDSCGKESIEAYNEGNNVGYTQGYYDGKAQCKNTIRTDTVFRPFPEYIDTIYKQRLQMQSKSSTIAEQVHEIIKLQEQKKAKSNENWFWRIVALSVIAWLVFKPKIIKLFDTLKDKFKKS